MYTHPYRVSELCFNGAALGEEGAQALGRALEALPADASLAIAKISLWDCGLTDAGVRLDNHLRAFSHIIWYVNISRAWF